MLNIALFGPPGAGKGTQSKILIDKYNLSYIATGDMLREEIKENTELGREAKEIIERGTLVSDDIIVKLIENKITMNSKFNGFLFDGFPRTVVQAYILEGLLIRFNTSLTCMISLEVPEKTLVERMIKRGKLENRKDDSIDVIQKRLKEYKLKTLTVIDFYKEKGIYYPMDGAGNMQNITDRIAKTIDSKYGNKLVNILLLGSPGAGKGTQAKILEKKFNLVYISTGAILREEIKNNSEIGKIAKPYMEKGGIVPDEIAIKIIERKIKKHKNVNGFLFKGFPHTLVQAYILDGLLRKLGTSITTTIKIETPLIQAIKRLSYRSKTEGARNYDKSTDIIIRRMEEYEKNTVPAINYYKNKKNFITIDGTKPEEEIHQNIVKSLESTLLQIK